MRKITIFIAMAACFFGCQKYYISVAQQELNEECLASTHVGTPDPRQENPPFGQRLIVEWQVPRDLLKKEPILQLHILYKDYTETYYTYPISHQMDYVVYDLAGEEFLQKEGILTYEVKILEKDGVLFRDWKHQLFVNLIKIEEEPVLQETLEPEQD